MVILYYEPTNERIKKAVVSDSFYTLFHLNDEFPCQLNDAKTSFSSASKATFPSLASHPSAA